MVWQVDITDVTELGVGITTDLVHVGNNAYGITTTERLLKIHIPTGVIAWEHPSAFEPETNYWNSCPDFSVDGILYFGTMDGHLKALDIAHDKLHYAKNIDSRITTSVVHHHGSVYFGAENQNIYRLTADGSQLDSLYLQTPNAMQIATHQDHVLIFTSDDLSTGGTEHLYALDTALADTVWSITATPETAWSIKRPYIYKDKLVIGDGFGGVYFLNPTDGSIVTSFELDGEIRSVGFDHNIAYVGTINGMVYAVRMTF